MFKQKLIIFTIGAIIATKAIFAVDNVPALDATLTQVRYPYPVASFNLINQNQRVTMAYMDIKASKPNGNTVVLLHGKNFNSSYWQDTAKQLSQLGYRVIAPDQIGFGKSSKPRGFQYSLQQLASDTNQLLQHLQINKAIIIGHSIGGMLAIRYALMYPQQTQALVLEDPIGLEDWRLSIPYPGIDKLYASEQKQTLNSLKQYQINSYYHGTWKDAYNQILEFQYGWVKGPNHDLIAMTSAQTTDMAFTQPVVYELNQIKAPTLLIVGNLDRTVLAKAFAPKDVANTLGNYPVLAKEAQAKIPNCQLVMIDGVGHVPHIEDPTDFYKALMPFLQNHLQ